MAKAVMALVKLQLPAGKANPAAPVGTALGPRGVNLMEFCKAFNAKTQNMGDDLIPVIVTVFEDRSFDMVTKTPPTTGLIKKELGLGKGSTAPGKEKVGSINREQLKKVAEQKMPDLNTTDIDQAIKIVAGSARSMGLEVTD